MKKLTIIAALFFSVNCYSQKDSIPESTEFISKDHIKTAYKNLLPKLKPLEDKLTVTEYNRLFEAIQLAYDELLNVATEEYRKKKKLK